MKNLKNQKTTSLLRRAAFLVCLMLITFSAFGQMAQNKEKWVGNIWYGSSEPIKFSEYWNQLTAENAGKWDAAEPRRDQMNWSTMDAMYKWTREKGFPYKHHVFVWGSQWPQWIRDIPANEQKEEVEEWIRLYGERYPDTEMIDVVNEMFHVTPPYKNAIGGDGATGWDWVVWAFEKARQYCPNSLLLINEYNVIEGWTPVRDYVGLVNILKSRNLIDGVGIQNHGLENIDINSIRSRTDELGRTGIPIYVSELDIVMNSESQQKDKYAQLFPLFYEHQDVAGVTLWGYIEGHHWRDNAWIMYSNGNERPALTWIRDYMESQPDVGTPTPTPEPTDPPTPTPDLGPEAIIVTAAGTMGGEKLDIKVDGNIVASFTLTTTMTDYLTEGTGVVQVVYTNDDDVDSGMDVQVDKISYHGQVFQAEDQEINTGVWQDSSCGGSLSEWLHCNGYIEFPTETGPVATTIPPNPTTPPPAEAELAISPLTKNVAANSSFTLGVALSSDIRPIASYGIEVKYDPSYITVDTAANKDGAEAGSDGYMAASNPGTTGTITITGFDVNGVGPGSDLDFLTLFFKTGSLTGNTYVSIKINMLTDADTKEVGANTIDGTIRIGPTGPGCVLKGDGNGDGKVDIVDALLAAQLYVDSNTNVAYPDCLDVNCSGSVDIVDALRIAQYYVGAINQFDC